VWTAQISDINLAPAEGTDVRHFRTAVEARAAWHAGYFNTADCARYWGGDLPAMSDSFTVTLWRGKWDDVTDVHPDSEVVLGRHGDAVRRRIY